MNKLDMLKFARLGVEAELVKARAHVKELEASLASFQPRKARKMQVAKFAKKKLSAAERKAISVRMKAYWAKRSEGGAK